MSSTIAPPAAASHWLDRLLAARRLRITILVALGIAVLFRFVQVAVALQGPAWGYDFSAYWFAARRLLSGEALYTAAQLAGPFPPQEQFAYLYPPFLAVVLAPLPIAFGSLEIAALFWSSVCLAVLAIVVWIAARLMHLSAVAAAVLIGATLALPAVGFEFVMGNVHFLLATLFVVAWLGVRRHTRGGEIVAGVAIGIALLIKIFPAVVVLWFVLAGRRTAALAAIVSALILAAATVPVVGLETWLVYPRVLANLGPPQELWSSVAPVSMLAEFIDFNAARLIVIAVGLAILAWSAWRQPAPISFSVAVMVSLLIVPTMYVHYLAVAVAPLLLMALHSRAWWWILLAYTALFIGSQAALIDLQPPAIRVLALMAAVAPLVALVLAGTRTAEGVARSE